MLEKLHSGLPLRPRKDGVQETDHFVEFYEDDIEIVGSLARFMGAALDRGEGALVVATPEHIEAFEDELGRTLDLNAARAEGRYLALAADEVLAHFMEGGRPHRDRFVAAVGAAVDRVAGDGRKVRVFGEMVALLWERGNVRGALELEDLWNPFTAERGLELFCAYPARLFENGSEADLAAISSRHTHVLAPR